MMIERFFFFLRRGGIAFFLIVPPAWLAYRVSTDMQTISVYEKKADLAASKKNNARALQWWLKAKKQTTSFYDHLRLQEKVHGLSAVQQKEQSTFSLVQHYFQTYLTILQSLLSPLLCAILWVFALLVFAAYKWELVTRKTWYKHLLRASQIYLGIYIIFFSYALVAFFAQPSLGYSVVERETSIFTGPSKTYPTCGKLRMLEIVGVNDQQHDYVQVARGGWVAKKDLLRV